MEHDHAPYGKSGSGFHIASGEADVAHVAPGRRTVFLLAQLYPTRARISRVFSPDCRHIFSDGPGALHRFKSRLGSARLEQVRFGRHLIWLPDKDRFFRLQAMDPNLTCFGGVLPSHPDYFEARLLIAVLDADGLANVDALNPNQPRTPLGDVQSMGALHEGLSVTVHPPHLYFKVDFHTRFAATAHKLQSSGS